ncbi:hypothetical protein [Microbulbifer sp. JMSA002]|uniref:hypothetical protein n=1 Tax=Microbulbifer sp. JMSA002 TaxID=3243368 RepID=UPI004039E340
MSVLIKVISDTFFAFMSEKILKRLIIRVLRELARRSENDIDDQVVEDMAETLNVKGS